MYLRYLARYRNTVSGKEETGIFRAADFVRDHTGLDETEKAELQALIAWFDENLPVPEFYDDPAKRKEDDHIYFWFKASAKEIVRKMDDFCAILERNGVEVRRLRAKTLPGEMHFEDHCQIAVSAPDDYAGIR